MTFQNKIALRPRFKLSSNKTKAEFLTEFLQTDYQKTGVYSSVIDAHIFLKITTKYRNFWSIDCWICLKLRMAVEFMGFLAQTQGYGLFLCFYTF